MATDRVGVVCSLFKKAVQHGRSKRRGEAYSVSYVEPLRVARTPLAAFFKRLLTGCLLAIGLWQIGEGSWIYAKARLAQYLLQRAWSRTLAGETTAKPWPWADNWPIARLIVPSRGIDLIVLNGAYGRTLAFGPGYVESSAFPGSFGTTILTGHRDTHFRFLKTLRKDEPILIHSRTGTWHRYRMRERQIVNADTAVIRQDDDARQLVLVTCYPFDAIVPGGPLRYVLTADLEDAE